MRITILGIALLCCLPTFSEAQEPLSSWNDSPSKQAIISFVERVTDEESPEFIPPSKRIATFDNDGCLWSEKPVYFQLLYAMDRVRALAPQHPEWKETEPFRSVLEGELEAVAATGKQGLMQLMAATHAGMTVDEFSTSVSDWIAEARHPTTGKRYSQMVYRPMLELLEYLRAHGFKTFVVSGGGIEFMRAWTEEIYGIPPEQVVGSSLKMTYDVDGGTPRILKLPEIDFIDDKRGKPIGIQRHIGRRPIFAAGNSDGDFEMLEWTTSGDGPRFGLLIHHTDAEREWAYDRKSAVGRLSRGLDQAKQRGWIIVDMQKDWKVIHSDRR